MLMLYQKQDPSAKNFEKVASCGLYTMQTVLDYTYTKVVSAVLPLTTNHG